MYRILIIEDDPGIAESIKAQADSWGFDSRTISDFRDIMPEFGMDDSLNSSYPRDIITEQLLEDPNRSKACTDTMREKINRLLESHGITQKNIIDYRYSSITGMLTKNGIESDSDLINEIDLAFSAIPYDFCFIPVEDYNRMMGTNESIGRGEAKIHLSNGQYTSDTINFIGSDSCFRIIGTLDAVPENGNASNNVITTVTVVISDYENALDGFANLGQLLMTRWYYCFDTPDLTDDEQETLAYDYLSSMFYESTVESKVDGMRGYFYGSRAVHKSDYFGTYGGLFFLGILLSIVFLFATVHMIYYKQISEGYEDASRFEIMRKVGMTKGDIKRNINSQMLSVFFLPIIFAIIHLAFAFPMINKLLLLFNLNNLGLFLATAGISIAVFVLFYVIVYRITSNAYHKIVSGADNR